MKPSTDLFELIKKLTPTEKRYFVLNSQLQKGRKNYLELFWEMDKMDDYDEELLKKKLADKEVKFAQFHVTKNSLSKQILKSLRAYYEKNVIQQKLFALMADANLLEGKGLFKQCLKKLRAGYILAEKNEYFRHQAEIQQKIIDVSVRIGVKDLRKFVSESYLDLSEIDFKSNLNSRTRRLSHLSYAIRQSRGKVSKEHLAADISQLRSNELPKIQQSIHSSFDAERNYHYTSCMLDTIEGKNPLTHHRNILYTWEKRPDLKETRIKEYKVDFYNYLSSCLANGELDEFESSLSEFKSIKDIDFISEAESIQQYYQLRLLSYLKTNQFVKAEELIPEIKRSFEKYNLFFFPSLAIAISSNALLVLFGAGRYDEAIDWNNLISAPKYKEFRPDIQVFARIMGLILNFEMGNHYYVELQQTNVYRGLKKQKQWGEYERAVLSTVRKLTRTIDKRQRKALWENLFTKLVKIHKKPGGRGLTGLIEVAVWCKSRSEGITYFEAAKLMG